MKFRLLPEPMHRLSITFKSGVTREVYVTKWEVTKRDGALSGLSWEQSAKCLRRGPRLANVRIDSVDCVTSKVVR